MPQYLRRTHPAEAVGTVFPAGLYQPEGSFRFSEDALLLAQFGLECLARSGETDSVIRFADLGTGCGVAGLALLLWGSERMYGLGVEREQSLAEAARLNARSLGMADRYVVLCRDVAELPDLSRRMRLVMANPPWLLSRSCRMPAAPLRRAALVGDEGTFFRFMNAAAALLEENGRVAIVTALERRDDALTALRGAGLFPYRLCLLRTRQNGPVRRVLLEGGLRPGRLHEEIQHVYERLPRMVRADRKPGAYRPSGE